MINFIVVDDYAEITAIIEKIINDTMKNSDLGYRIHIFHDYDKKFMKVCNSPIPNKVYFLDIETKSASGIDIARLIRKNDIKSVISFITVHEQMACTIIKESLMALTFISKLDNFEPKVKEAVQKSLEVIGSNKMLKFYDKNTMYIIPINDIIYATRDSVERKCIIKTDYDVYKVNLTLSELKDLSSGYLTQTHRSCLVNERRIRKIDKINKVIVFDNDDEINMLSNAYGKELIKC